MSRLVGGVAGGRRLVMPKGRATRPTSDRVREGLFSSLGGDLSGRSFLDLYAGSGAVGLEAASRGASPVVLVERDPRALEAIRANVTALGLAGVQVRAEAVSRFLADGDRHAFHVVSHAFDVVFVDPPYADPVDDLLATLFGDGWVAVDGVVVVERAARDPEPSWPGGVVTDRSRRYGDSTLWYGRRP